MWPGPVKGLLQKCTLVVSLLNSDPKLRREICRSAPDGGDWGGYSETLHKMPAILYVDTQGYQTTTNLQQNYWHSDYFLLCFRHDLWLLKLQFRYPAVGTPRSQEKGLLLPANIHFCTLWLAAQAQDIYMYIPLINQVRSPYRNLWTQGFH